VQVPAGTTAAVQVCGEPLYVTSVHVTVVVDGAGLIVYVVLAVPLL
jgi:hypothetical protein